MTYSEWCIAHGLVWLDNLNFEMASFICNKVPTKDYYVQLIYVLINYSDSVNKFINDNLCKGNKIKEEALAQFVNYTRLIADFTLLNKNSCSEEILSLISTIKRCKGILKNES